MLIDFVDRLPVSLGKPYGVEPICRLLQIAPWAYRRRLHFGKVTDSTTSSSKPANNEASTSNALACQLAGRVFAYVELVLPTIFSVRELW